MIENLDTLSDAERRAIAVVTAGMDSAAQVRTEADRLKAQAEASVKAMQMACPHPFGVLTYVAGAVEHHMAHGTDRQIYVRCGACEKSFTINVLWRKD